MRKLIGCSVVCLFLFIVNASAQTNSLTSPDSRIQLNFQLGNRLSEILSFQLFYSNNTVVNEGRIKLDMIDQNLVLRKVKHDKKRGRWQTVYGERKFIPDNYNELRLFFRSEEDASFQLVLLLRLYNEGFAYQYTLNHNTEIVLNNESSQFRLPENSKAWVSATAQGLLAEKGIGDIKVAVERPLTAQINDSLYAAFGEAALVDFARMKFTSDHANSLITKLDGQTRSARILRSPWRYVLIADSPAGLLERNYLVMNLNAPNQIKDTKWIQPGKVIRETTLTTRGAFQTIDFASRHKLQYILFDAGWYGKEDADSSDARTVTIDPPRYKGPLDLQKVIEYGNSKGVGVILYVNRRALETQLDSLLPLYHSWGVKGIKFGFVQVGSQRWTSWLHEAIRKCAAYQMIVDVHDEYRPTGYSRTYPNLLTQEGIRGDEESPFTEQTITTLFTRMIAGAADNTNCYFTGRVDKMGSHTAQMAKALCIYSPLQVLYWYDHPKTDSGAAYREAELREVPELKWYDELPVTWDETKVLEGDMRAFATIARRKGLSWYVGSLNGTSPRTLKLPLDFLDSKQQYIATVYTHNPEMKTATHVQIRSMDVDAGSVLSLPISSRDGIAIQISPK